MLFFRVILIVSAFFLFTGNTSPVSKTMCMEIVSHMLDSMKHIKTQTYDLKATERVNGKFLHAESTLKINTSPKKIYFKSKLKGVEVLWIQGQNKGDAIVHSPSFTLANLNLDPYGSLMRKDQHHTIFDLGLQHIGIIVANTIVKAPKDFEKHFAYAGSIVWNNTDCYQLLISFPDYKYVEYTVQKGETVTDIARKMNTSDFKIRYKNELSGYYTNLKEGKKIMIPMPYANKVLMYIDKKSYLPVSVKIYDEEGLFEAYDFYNITVNKTFAPEEFSVNYKGYNFRKS
jgi:hypothetical protein